MKGRTSKQIRRKSAMTRLQQTVEEYQQKMSSITDEEVLKKLQKKVNHHKLAIENTMNYLKRT